MTVSFEVQVYNSSPRFNIPKNVRTQLGVDNEDSVYLTIKTTSGDHLFTGRKTLRSGPEIYGADLIGKVTPGSRILVEASDPIVGYRFPSEEAANELAEGHKTWVSVNRFERNRKARKKCIEIFGPICQVCGFDFETRYGKLGRGFIHVHHIVPISTIGKSYTVDPQTDLRPVCPNCHEMLHRKNPPLSIEDLQTLAVGF